LYTFCLKVGGITSFIALYLDGTLSTFIKTIVFHNQTQWLSGTTAQRHNDLPT
jgi:hypothetical protein